MFLPQMRRTLEKKAQETKIADLNDSYIKSMDTEQYRHAYAVVKECHEAAMDAARGVATRLAVQKGNLERKVSALESEVLELRIGRSNIKKIAHALKRRVKKYESDKLQLLAQLQEQNSRLRSQMSVLSGNGYGDNCKSPAPAENEKRHGFEEESDEIVIYLGLLEQLHRFKALEDHSETSLDNSARDQQKLRAILMQENAMLTYSLHVVETTLSAQQSRYNTEQPRQDNTSNTSRLQPRRLPSSENEADGVSAAACSVNSTSTILQESARNLELLHQITLALLKIGDITHDQLLASQ